MVGPAKMKDMKVLIETRSKQLAQVELGRGSRGDEVLRITV